MNVPNKFVSILSDEEMNKLRENYQKAENFRVRNRSQAILLSGEGFSIAEIARICKVHRTAVSRWIDNWGKHKFASLADAERTGRPKTLTPEEEERVIALTQENPRFVSRQIERISREAGKQISVFTLKGLLKKKIICGKESS